MDETLLWMDMPGDTTIARTGVKSVPLLTSGHEKIGLLYVWQRWLVGKS